jgi:hypothetical protein
MRSGAPTGDVYRGKTSSSVVTPSFVGTGRAARLCQSSDPVCSEVPKPLRVRFQQASTTLLSLLEIQRNRLLPKVCPHNIAEGAARIAIDPLGIGADRNVIHEGE